MSLLKERNNFMQNKFLVILLTERWRKVNIPVRRYRKSQSTHNLIFDNLFVTFESIK